MKYNTLIKHKGCWKMNKTTGDMAMFLDESFGLN